MMKYLFIVFVIILGCTPRSENNVTTLKYDFLESQLENSRASLKLKLQGDERKIGPIYSNAMLVDNRCEELINSVRRNDKREVIIDSLEKLKEYIKRGLSYDSLLLANTNSAIDELIHQKDYSDSLAVIERINLINFSFLTRMHLFINEFDYVSDYLQVFVKNRNGKEGKLFETELLPVYLSTTQKEIVRIGTGVDSSNHLTGKIDTLKRNEFHFSVYRAENPRKGIYNIPAEIITSAAGGKKPLPVRFTIQYEIR